MLVKAPDEAIVEPFEIDSDSLPRPLMHARRASRYSRNHRGFFTGSVVEAHAPALPRRFFAGCAYKPVKEPKLRRQRRGKRNSIPHNPRYCGEHRPLNRVCDAWNFGLQIKCIYIAGDHQPDDLSNIDIGALIPCKHCRKKMRWHVSRETGVIVRETMVYSWNINTDKAVGFSVGWLLHACPDTEATYERYSQ